MGNHPNNRNDRGGSLLQFYCKARSQVEFSLQRGNFEPTCESIKDGQYEAQEGPGIRNHQDYTTGFILEP